MGTVKHLSVIEGGNGQGDVDSILKAAQEVKYKHVLIVGLCQDGTYETAYSEADPAELNWMVDMAKREILEGDE